MNHLRIRSLRTRRLAAIVRGINMRRLLTLLLLLGLPGRLVHSQVPPSAARTARAEDAPAGAPPAVGREFRAAWVATVKNIDWPSRPGLPVPQQQAELRNLIELAARLNLNALLLQVRPSCDALYDSPHEPWSEFLSGRQGQRPQPFWDPLTFAVNEAHARGLELHAWFNPFRAGLQGKNASVATNHITRKQPQLVRQYGGDSWLDPGESDARDHAIKVILDVVRRYDIDGVHLDDYFYPYPPAGVKMGFPDDRSWLRYQRSGGRLERDDWRRENVNTFVHQLSEAIHREKAWLRFGISPFGIWRPGNPPAIRGMDAFDVIYADSRKWLQAGWVDYLSPQLYWAIGPREQSFPVLLNWWAEQNTRNLPIWPGLATARIGQDRNAQEILNQVRLLRRQPAADGMLFWNFSSLRSNLGGIAGVLTNSLFPQPALVPEVLAGAPERPVAPELEFELNAQATRLALKWSAPTNEPARRYVLQSRYGRGWRTELLGDAANTRVYDRSMGELVPQEVVLTPIGRGGVAGQPAKWNRTPHEAPRAAESETDSEKPIVAPVTNPSSSVSNAVTAPRRSPPQRGRTTPRVTPLTPPGSR